MRIEVRLCQSLARHRRDGGAFALFLKDGATVGDALARLRLPHGGLRLALCNGASLLGADGAMDTRRPLSDGDHLVFRGEARGAFALPVSSFLQRLSGLLSPLAQNS